VKKRIGHGGFLRWIEAEFGMSCATAERFMRVSENLGEKFVTVTNLSPSILYALAAPSTPEPVIQEVVERAAAGERVTSDDVKALKEKYEAENDELKQKLAETKLKERDAKASTTDISQQLAELQKDLAGLRDERDTLLHRLSTQGKSSSNFKVADDPLLGPMALEKQVARLMTVWNETAPDAREEFLGRIEVPVMDAKQQEPAQ
jgi:hypothetical protein